MIILLIELVPVPGKRAEILDLLRFSVDQAKSRRGCFGSGVYEACNETRTILYLEQWGSDKEMNRHVQSDPYRSVLNVLDLAASPPAISFHEISGTKSMDLIEALRSPGSPG